MSPKESLKILIKGRPLMSKFSKESRKERWKDGTLVGTGILIKKIFLESKIIYFNCS